MKSFFGISLALVVTIFITAGCATTQNLTSSITSKVGSITSNVDDKLYSQVPEDERHGISKAESELKAFDEKLKLAALKNELAGAQKEYYKLQADLVEKDYKAASLNLDIAKVEAIDRAGLGDKAKNIKNIANLKTKKHTTEGDRIKVEARISIAERKIRELTEQVKQQDDVVSNLPTRGNDSQGEDSRSPTGEDEKSDETDGEYETPEDN